MIFFQGLKKFGIYNHSEFGVSEEKKKNPEIPWCDVKHWKKTLTLAYTYTYTYTQLVWWVII